MINKQTQKNLNNFAASTNMLFVFRSKVHYDVYLPIQGGVLKFDADFHTWVKTDFASRDDVIQFFMDTNPVYKNSEIHHNLDWDFGEEVKSETNVSLKDW